MKYHPTWRVTHLRPNGSGEYEKIYEEEIKKNILTDAGETAILSAFFAKNLVNYGVSADHLYLGLALSAVAEATNIGGVTGEAWQGGGYTRKIMPTNQLGLTTNSWYIVQANSLYFQANSDVAQWTATGNWLPVNSLLLVSSATGGSYIW